MPRPRGATWRDAARTRASIVRRCVTSDVNRPTLWWYCGAVTSARFDERQVLPLAMFFGSFSWSFVYISLPFHIQRISTSDAAACPRPTAEAFRPSPCPISMNSMPAC